MVERQASTITFARGRAPRLLPPQIELIGKSLNKQTPLSSDSVHEIELALVFARAAPMIGETQLRSECARLAKTADPRAGLAELKGPIGNLLRANLPPHLNGEDLIRAIERLPNEIKEPPRETRGRDQAHEGHRRMIRALANVYLRETGNKPTAGKNPAYTRQGNEPSVRGNCIRFMDQALHCCGFGGLDEKVQSRLIVETLASWRKEQAEPLRR